MLTFCRFVICNEGYTIERYIHGWDAKYNDIQPWDYANIPKAFGAKENYQGYRIKTRDELNKLFADQEFNSSDKLRVSHLPRSFYNYLLIQNLVG
jgi:pyruvate decarboxylase